jgi:uncharacterized damage-inducible protein DinB
MSRLWTERQFAFDFPAEIYPIIVGRLRGTPARLEERIADLPLELLVRRPESGWSIQEHAGHLIEVEALFDGRLGEYEQGLAELRPADMSNQRTEAADFNSQDIGDVLMGFREVRTAFIARIDAWLPERFSQRAWHPRLKTSMRACDMLSFMAEHDDHHLARINDLTVDVK